MKKLLFLVSVLMVVNFSLFAKEDHDHDHSDIKPTKGGKIFELNDHAGFVEVVHDAVKGEVSLFLLNHEGKALKIKETPKLNLFVKEGKVKKKKQVETTFKDAEQKESDAFVGKDDALKSKELDGRISIKIGDKTYQVNLKPEHDHDH